MPQPLTVLPAPEVPAQAELDRLRARVEAGGPEAVRAALALLERLAVERAERASHGRGRPSTAVPSTALAAATESWAARFRAGLQCCPRSTNSTGRWTSLQNLAP